MSIEQGTLSEHIFTTELLKRNFDVYLPVIDNGVDCIIKNKNGYKSIQVKSTHKPDMRYPNKPSYKINVRRGFDSRPYDKGEFDFFAIHLIDIDVWYIIPFKEVASKSTIRISNMGLNCKYAKYKYAFHYLT